MSLSILRLIKDLYLLRTDIYRTYTSPLRLYEYKGHNNSMHSFVKDIYFIFILRHILVVMTIDSSGAARTLWGVARSSPDLITINTQQLPV